MSIQELDGNSLGEKHKNFNKLVRNAVTNEQINLSKINYDDSDIENLLKIHTACRTKNVDYIIEVLKCEDMLYVSTAIKQSTWLITEQEHAHIVNPEYLYTQLFPHMLTKAVNKLLLHIRLHLKDEKRVEAFYDYLKNVTDEAHKWLMNCSIPFIENVIRKEREIPLKTFKRLCKRSIKFLQYHSRVQGDKDYSILQGVLFLTRSYTDEYLNVLDSLDSTEHYLLPWFTKCATEAVMKKCPQRILAKIFDYQNKLHLASVAKFMKKDDIADFLYKCLKDCAMRQILREHKILNHFIENMPVKERLQFIEKTKLLCGLTYKEAIELDCAISCSSKPYIWYQYIPFDTAFTELTKLITAESSPEKRCDILVALVTCAKNDPRYTKRLLQYYYEKHRNETSKFKFLFVNNIIKESATHDFDPETWNILDKLFCSLSVYSKSENDIQTCIRAIIVYKILHNENIPDNVEKKFIFNTMKKLQCNLNIEQKDKIFSYLLKYIVSKIQNNVIESETDLDTSIDFITKELELLVDWNKNIADYPFVLNDIKELLIIREQNSWKSEMALLYTKNKLWRRHMFEESLLLSPNEEVCLNVLKHDLQLFARHSKVIDALRTNDTISLKQLLIKLRVYWPHSLAKQWIDAYFDKINDGAGDKAVIKGILYCLPQKQLTNFAQQFVPVDAEIEWNEVSENTFKLRKNIASSLHVARPLISLDVVLWYTKGDYLQFTIPSLNAIIHNISRTDSLGYIPKLLEAPVSLQKQGIHLAFTKLNCDELKSIFSGLWQNNTDLRIRMHIFNHTYNLLCKVKKQFLAKQIWTLLSMFIDNLPPEENVAICNKLHKVKNVSIHVQGHFFMKSYTFFKSIPSSEKCKKYKHYLILYAPLIMDQLDADFVVEKMLTPIDEKVLKADTPLINVMSSFLLHGTTEKEQCDRFSRVLAPALEYAFIKKANIDTMLEAVIIDFRRFIFTKKIIIPVKLFSEIKSFMDIKMPRDDYYVQHTLWQLVTDYVKLVDEHKEILNDESLDIISILQFRSPESLPEDAEDVWITLHTAIAPKIGPIILKHLKEDVEEYFPTIFRPFSDALVKMFECLTFTEIDPKMEILKYMLDIDFIPSYLVVCEFQKSILEYACLSDGGELRTELREILSSHPSLEVRMHYYRTLGFLPY